MLLLSKSSTYDHRILKTRLPVRSALFKQDTGGLVVRWVTTSESPLLYVFAIILFLLLVWRGAKWVAVVASATSADFYYALQLLFTCLLLLKEE
jgi:hypothetical protein